MVVTHYTGALRTLFSFFCFYCLFRIFLFSSIRFCLLRRARFLRSQRNSHSLTFQQGHLLYFCIFFQVIRKTKQQYFALFFEKNGTTFKEHICFHLVSVLQESDGMFQLEVVVMIICLRSETDFLYVSMRTSLARICSLILCCPFKLSFFIKKLLVPVCFFLF